MRESAEDVGVSRRAVDGVRRQTVPPATAVEMIGITVTAEVVMKVDKWPRGSDINKKANREVKR